MSSSPSASSLGPTLETPRLILRVPVREDFEGFVQLMSEERSARFIGGVQPRSLVWRGFTSLVGSWAVLGFGMFSVFEKESGRWVGRIGAHCPEGWPGTEVGYSLLPEFWGKGYAVEAATRCIDWAFSELGWTDVIHSIHPENVASQAVARRLGATNRGPGHLPAPYADVPIDIWGYTRAQWEGR